MCKQKTNCKQSRRPIRSQHFGRFFSPKLEPCSWPCSTSMLWHTTDKIGRFYRPSVIGLKRGKDEEVNGQGGRWVPRPHTGRCWIVWDGWHSWHLPIMEGLLGMFIQMKMITDLVTTITSVTKTSASAISLTIITFTSQHRQSLKSCTDIKSLTKCISNTTPWIHRQHHLTVIGPCCWLPFLPLHSKAPAAQCY